MKPIDIMHNYFGHGNESDLCGKCSNLIRSDGYFKCSVYGISSSEATDWRKKWESCGMFNKEYTGIPVREVAGYLPRVDQEEQIEGQMSIFDFMGENNV